MAATKAQWSGRGTGGGTGSDARNRTQHHQASATSYSATTQAIFQAMLMQSRAARPSPTLIAIAFAVEFVQMAGLMLSSDLPWYPPLAHAASPILQPFLLQTLVFGSLATTITISAIFVGNVTVVVIVTRMRLHLSWATKLLRVCSSLVTSVLFIPLLVPLLQAVVCPTCFQGGSLQSSMVALITVIVLLLATALMLVTNYDVALSTSRDPLARPHSRFELLYGIVFRTVFVAVLLQSSWTPNVVLALVGVASAGTAFAYTSYIPTEFVVARAAFLWMVTWAAICLLVTNAESTTAGLGPTLAFIATSPVVVVVTYVLVHMRRAQVLATPFDKLKNSLEVEMRARFALQDASRDEASSAQTAAVQEVGALFGDTCGKFHDSPLFIWFQALFTFEFVGNLYQGYNLLEKADALVPLLDVQFLIYRQRSLSMDTLMADACTREIVAYVFGEMHATNAIACDDRATDLQLAFWRELSKPDPALDDIQRHALHIRRAAISAQSHYDNAIKLRRTDTNVMLRFVSFLREFEPHNEGRAAVIESRVHDLLKQERHAAKPNVATTPSTLRQTRHSGLNTEGDPAAGDFQHGNDVTVARFKDALGAESNGVVVVSIADSTFGRILQVNHRLQTMFGQAERDLVGSNIGMLIPPPYADVHDGRHALLNHGEIRMLALHANGHLLPVSVILRAFSQFGSSLAVLAIVTERAEGAHHWTIDSRRSSIASSLSSARETGSQSALLIVGNDNGRVYAVGEGIDTIWQGRTPQSNITDLVPNYFTDRDALLAPNGIVASMSVGNHRQCRVQVDRTVAYGQSLHVDHVTLTVVDDADRQQGTAAAQLGPDYAADQVLASRYLAELQRLDEERAEHNDSDPGDDKTSVSSEQPLENSASQQEPSLEPSASDEDDAVQGRAAGPATPTVQEAALSGPSTAKDLPARSSAASGLSDTSTARWQYLSNIDAIWRREVLGRSPAPIRRVRRVVIGTAIVVILLFIVLIAYVNSTLLTVFVARNVYVSLAGTRRIAMVSIARDAHALQLIQQGILPAATLSATLQDLGTYATMLVNVDSNLATDSYNAMSQNGVVFGTGVDVTDVVDVSVVNVSYSLFDIDRLVVARSRRAVQVATVALSNVTSDLDEVLRTSFVGSVLDRMDASVVGFESDAASQVASMQTGAQIAAVTITIAIACVCVITLRDPIVHVETIRNKVAGQFLKVPMQIVGKKLSRASARAGGTEAMLENGISAMKERTFSQMERLTRAARQRRYAHLWQMWARLALPFILMVVFLIVLWYAAYANISGTMKLAPPQVQASSDRSLACLEIALLLRVLATPTSTFLQTSPGAVRDKIDEFAHLHRQLTYGSAMPQMPGTVYDTSTLQDGLLYQSACIDATGQAPHCPSFDNGVMSSGLHSAVLEYVDLAQVALSEIVATCAAVDCRRRDVQTSLLSMPDLVMVDTLQRSYLFDALRVSEADFSDSLSSASMQQFRRLVLFLVAGFVAAVTLAYVNVFRPALAQLEQHASQTRALLGMVPVDADLPTLQLLVNDNVATL
ncbi:PAS domain-containing protein [Plasmodiophora brassicae]|uniref:PAS domain-containing protein n=1 Tax=Plasmodiophora brassicae TaxID=37360 RepID=A0A0G4IV42_PLABS|nr:hypothetical protein PBRA_007143 [Plasmodiophora brassicae]